jgi:hypothetical protein
MLYLEWDDVPIALHSEHSVFPELVKKCLYVFSAHPTRGGGFGFPRNCHHRLKKMTWTETHSCCNKGKHYFPYPCFVALNTTLKDFRYSINYTNSDEHITCLLQIELRLYKVFLYCIIFRVTEPEGGRTLTFGHTHTHTTHTTHTLHTHTHYTYTTHTHYTHYARTLHTHTLHTLHTLHTH